MTGEPPAGSVWLRVAHGPVQTGSGVQNNNYYGTTGLRRGPIVLDADAGQVLIRVFVEPPGWPALRDQMREPGVLLLRGAAGSGRRTAALRLLEERADAAPVRELSAAVDDDRGPLFDGDDVVEGDRLLLDLSGSTQEELARAVVELRGFRSAVATAGAFLVVVLPASASPVVLDELRTVTVQRPDGGAVLASHLDEYDLPAPTGELPDRIPELLRTGTPATIARLAWLARLAWPAQPDEPEAGRLHRCLDVAVGAVLDHGQTVTALVKARSGGAERTLLLAAAVFAGRRSGVVCEAERALARRAGLADATVPELARPDLGTRLAVLQAAVRDDRVVFEGVDLDAALRLHFWAHFPGLRDLFRDWLVEHVPRVTAEGDPVELVVRFVDACVAVDRSEDVLMAVQHWAIKPASERLAAAALDHGLHGRTAAGFRRRCREWATQRTLSPPLARLVIDASRYTIAPHRPQQAVVRLHHLLHNADPTVADAAHTALVDLAGVDRTILRRVLSRFTVPGTGTAYLEGAADRRLLLAVAAPERLLSAPPGRRALIDDRTVVDQLGTGWRALHARDDADVREAAVWSWLDAHASQPDADRLLDVLVGGAGSATGPLALLFSAALRWRVHGESDAELAHRDRTVRELHRRIHIARRPAPGGTP